MVLPLLPFFIRTLREEVSVIKGDRLGGGDGENDLFLFGGI